MQIRTELSERRSVTKRIFDKIISFVETFVVGVN